MEEVLLQLARRLQNKYYGKYRGFVVDNDDPEQLGRVRLLIPSVLGETETGWALPCLPFGGLEDQGFFAVPGVDAQVWVEFEEGNINAPIWVGVFWQNSGEIPSEGALNPPTTTVIKTSSGHTFHFDDEENAEKICLIHKSGAELCIDENGTVVLKDAQKNALTLDADGTTITLEDANGNTLSTSSTGMTLQDCNGNKIDMTTSGITIKAQEITVEGTQVLLAGAGGEPVIKGQSFLTLFATHIHPTGVGPSGPPVPQGEMSTLSMKTMTT
ncbi:phage tail protein [candidate division LCP-89 bacterium B3_LCP]|uniref:Phage tail protein n=1 Tax=candidate division LCP-89 bacterium B3_LCP TaxID=2012998 RepID=A0A532UUB1_UNCL8|nr:MAG: phage tail protein [candidate division LCP-89 bacterium B3_LCP]